MPPCAEGYECVPPYSTLPALAVGGNGVADVFKLAPFDLPCLHRLSWCYLFKRLNCGQFITTHNLSTHLMQQWCIRIQPAYRFDLFSEGLWVRDFGLGV